MVSGSSVLDRLKRPSLVNCDHLFSAAGFKEQLTPSSRGYGNCWAHELLQVINLRGAKALCCRREDESRFIQDEPFHLFRDMALQADLVVRSGHGDAVVTQSSRADTTKVYKTPPDAGLTLESLALASEYMTTTALTTTAQLDRHSTSICSP